MNYPSYASLPLTGQSRVSGPSWPYAAMPNQGATLPQFFPRYLNGSIVPSVESITANDVPMDGSISVFPKLDLSEIYVKKWEANGTIKTIIYRPVIEDNQDNAEASLKNSVTSIESRLDELTEKVESLISKKKSSKREDETV